MVQAVAARKQDITDDAALVVAGQNVALDDALGGDRIAEPARPHQALARQHVDGLLWLVAPQQRVEKVASFGKNFQHDALVRIIGRQDLTLVQVLPPLVNLDENPAGRDFDPLDFPVPKLLDDSQGHQHDNRNEQQAAH